MVSYPNDYDSSGEIQSREFHDHVGNAQTLPHQGLNFPIPFGLTVTLKNGRRDSMVKLNILGVGNTCVVLRGIDALTRLVPRICLSCKVGDGTTSRMGTDIGSYQSTLTSPQFVFGFVKA